MDPFTIALLASLAISAVKAGVEAVPGKNEKRQKKRLDELLQLQDTGQLGLSQGQKQRMSSDATEQIRNIQKQSESLRKQYAAESGSAGQAFEQLGQVTQQQQVLQNQAGAQAARQAAELSERKAEMQRNEIERRLEAQQVKNKKKADAIIGAGEDAVGAGLTYGSTQNLIGGAGQPNNVNQVMRSYGTDDRALAAEILRAQQEWANMDAQLQAQYPDMDLNPWYDQL